MRLSRRHPRYASLLVRARLADASRRGLVVPEGLIAQGRGEAFDYLLGERSTPSARRAARTAARWLLAARRPVVSVNGNVAALASAEVAALQRAVPGLAVEVNLFHRTPARARAVARELRRAGVRGVLGVRPTARILHLPSDRALVDARGIARADVCLVPLEDGDRAEALRRAGKRVIAIDLNPLSRTARAADVPIVDELGRALRNITAAARARRVPVRAGELPPFDAWRALAEALEAIDRRLSAVGPPHRRRG
ncbi:MAG TPA: phosphopantothenate/pantothenate synthetase [Thermoplasmata archaeon]|nr:phosphopantothenate/pantothenate synthetase [Thermoplasmata archaeon]